jgi:ribosomal protein S18 acetylase RimI-like enzyme
MSESDRSLSVDSLSEADARIANVLPWLHEAGNPYWDWLWGSPAEGRAQLNDWLRRVTSELSEKNIIYLREENRIVGGYIAFPGRELQTCRRADLHALTSYVRRNPDKDVTGRMRQARSLFADVSETQFYLSRIGVAAEARGRGMGRRLLDMFVQQGRNNGFKDFRVDVCTENEPAIRMYCAAGFVVTSKSAISEPPFHYCSMVATV